MNDFCWKSGWSASIAKVYSNIVLGIWSCKFGAFDYLLNDNKGKCGLKAYKFKNPVFSISYDDMNLEGVYFPEMCFG